MLLVFALGQLTQPVLGALEDVHQLTAHADSASGHTGHHSPHGRASATPAGERGAGGPMDELLHYAHCCGHSVGLASSNLALPNFKWPDPHPSDPMASPVSASHAGAPFRPPISA